MSITHELGGSPAHLSRSFRKTIMAPTSQLAEMLIQARYLGRGNYLERAHLDSRWMTALFVRAIVLRKALGIRPTPDLAYWMDD
jgi:hypothetical protein